MTAIDIRLMTPAHLDDLRLVAEETGLFPGDMLDGLAADFLGPDPQDLWVSCLVDGVARGFCFLRPEALTDRTSNMLALAVLPG